MRCSVDFCLSKIFKKIIYSYSLTAIWYENNVMICTFLVRVIFFVIFDLCVNKNAIIAVCIRFFSAYGIYFL